MHLLDGAMGNCRHRSEVKVLPGQTRCVKRILRREWSPPIAIMEQHQQPPASLEKPLPQVRVLRLMPQDGPQQRLEQAKNRRRAVAFWTVENLIYRHR